MNNLPVLLVVFRRPQVTKNLLKLLSDYGITNIYIFSDAPQTAQDKAKNDEVKHIVNCDPNSHKFQLNYQAENLGCKYGVYNAISWFFSEVDAGIILEDDCVPNRSFFRFTEMMLERYREADDIGIISGNNFQLGKRIGSGSYYYSKYPNTWGWATWRNVWQNFDIDRLDEIVKQGKWSSITKGLSTKEVEFWDNVYENLAAGKFDAWDYQFVLYFLKAGLKVIVPNKNLVTNIGFDGEGTHTQNSAGFKIRREELSEVISPKSVKVSESADLFMFENFYLLEKNWKYRFRNWMSGYRHVLE